jgi:hypothetical protein
MTKTKIKNVLFTITFCLISSILAVLVYKSLNPCHCPSLNTANIIKVPSETPTPVKIENADDITRELQEIKDELARIRAEQRGVNQILGAATSGSVGEFIDAIQSLEETTASPTPTPKALGYVKANSTQFNSVDIYQSPSFSSTVIAQMENTRSYPYFEKKDNWYLIEMPGLKRGYVNAKFILEETLRTP